MTSGVRPPKLIAGCLQCSGMTPRWRGKASHGQANSHAGETGHDVWTGQQERPPRKTPPATPDKPPAPSPPPLQTNGPVIPKGRLSKRAMCDGKVAHASPAAAQMALERTRGMREFLNIYQCFYCGKWHVGHLIKPEAKA